MCIMKEVYCTQCGKRLAPYSETAGFSSKTGQPRTKRSLACPSYLEGRVSVCDNDIEWLDHDFINIG